MYSIFLSDGGAPKRRGARSSLTVVNKKFEIMLFRFRSLAENWGVHAKLIYKYQILYLDRIKIVSWRPHVNGVAARKCKKIHKTPYFGVQSHSR